MKINKLHIALILLFIFSSCSREKKLFNSPKAKSLGVDFSNSITETDNLNILDYLYFYNGGGIAIGDINNDGLPDIFLSGNQVKNALYINKGDLQFQDVSESAGIKGNSSWNTGAVMADINNDGLLDIYVCAVVGINGFVGHNELFINNGDQTFTEQSKKYGLDFETYSSNATFLDYDKDGDLDMYLLNHAVHTQNSYGHADLRNERNVQTGDKLLRNDGETFTDVSETAGIFGGINSYGLGVAVSDFNKDGWPDIYVGNDFHEDDYFYLNNGDGTFKESVKTYFGHTSRFSMGSDVADINKDGWPDLISLDMLPEDEEVLKSTEGDDNIQTQKMRINQYGYHYQFTRNMLYLNRPNSHFEEVALQANVAATDWSWSALFSDFNQDGNQDLFISNGIPKRPNDLDYIKFLSSNQIQQKINNTKLVDQKALEMMPSGNVSNYIFKGTDGIAFEDYSEKWISNDTLVSGATALADLDNDGDLDIVTNNLNQHPTFYINQTNQNANYLKIKLNYTPKNRMGIGTKIYVYTNGELDYREFYTIRGFQGSSQPIVHFGLGKATQVDSIRVEWPNQTYQVVYNVEANQTKEITPYNTKQLVQNPKQRKPLFKKVDGNLGLNFTHIEDNYTDFIRQKLMPYQASDRGPAVAIGDLNNDSKDDVFFGGSKRFEAQLFVQNDTAFAPIEIQQFKDNLIKEDVSAVIEDFNNDGKKEIYIGTGGADFFGESKALKDTYFNQNNELLNSIELPNIYQNASVVATHDFDDDGDIDLFVGSHIITSDFGKSPSSTILINENGNFTAKPIDVGMVTDAVWDDFDSDGKKELVVVGEWMTPKFFKIDTKGEVTEVNKTKSNLKGLWQSIQPFDIDGDGDTDYLIGNWGLNSKFKASKKYPLQMYYGDFDANKQTETIICTEKNGVYYPLGSLDDLAGQLVSLRKKFNSYKSFAGKSIDQLFDKETLSKAELLEVNTLESGYLRNDNGKFSFVPFNSDLQVAPILAFLKADFDNDNAMEVLAAGNYFGVKPYHGRFDSFSGALIKDESNIQLGYTLGLNLNNKSTRHLNLLNVFGKKYVLVTYNNDAAEVYEIL